MFFVFGEKTSELVCDLLASAEAVLVFYSIYVLNAMMSNNQDLIEYHVRVGTITDDKETSGTRSGTRQEAEVNKDVVNQLQAASSQTPLTLPGVGSVYPSPQIPMAGMPMMPGMMMPGILPRPPLPAGAETEEEKKKKATWMFLAPN